MIELFEPKGPRFYYFFPETDLEVGTSVAIRRLRWCGPVAVLIHGAADEDVGGVAVPRGLRAARPEARLGAGLAPCAAQLGPSGRVHAGKGHARQARIPAGRHSFVLFSLFIILLACESASCALALSSDVLCAETRRDQQELPKAHLPRRRYAESHHSFHGDEADSELCVQVPAWTSIFTTTKPSTTASPAARSRSRAPRRARPATAPSCTSRPPSGSTCSKASPGFVMLGVGGPQAPVLLARLAYLVVARVCAAETEAERAEWMVFLMGEDKEEKKVEKKQEKKEEVKVEAPKRDEAAEAAAAAAAAKAREDAEAYTKKLQEDQVHPARCDFSADWLPRLRAVVRLCSGCGRAAQEGRGAAQEGGGRARGAAAEEAGG